MILILIDYLFEDSLKLGCLFRFKQFKAFAILILMGDFLHLCIIDAV